MKVISMNINDYLFFEDGEQANACTYTAGPNAGKTLVKYHGKTYEAKEQQGNSILTACEEIIRKAAETLTPAHIEALKAIFA